MQQRQRFNNLWSIIFLVFAVSAVSASPTTKHRDIILTATQHSAESPIAISCPADVPADCVNAALVELGRKILQPPASLAGSRNTEGAYAKPLPAVPAAVFMVLSGFLCVSAVKDRKVWLAALAGLLWAGQTGIQAIPQLAVRLGYRNHSGQDKAELSYLYCFEDVRRLCSDINGTGYIGLLHHLGGIPDRPVSFLQSRLSFLRKQESRKVTTQLCCRFDPSKNTNSFQSQSAFLTEQYSLHLLFVRLASIAERYVCFTPAFIFDTIPRGPPILTKYETFP